MAKATWDNPIRKPFVVPPHRLSADSRRDVVSIVVSEFTDCVINAQLGVRDKGVHQIPGLLIGIDTCQG